MLQSQRTFHLKFVLTVIMCVHSENHQDKDPIESCLLLQSCCWDSQTYATFSPPNLLKSSNTTSAQILAGLEVGGLAGPLKILVHLSELVIDYILSVVVVSSGLWEAH